MLTWNSVSNSFVEHPHGISNFNQSICINKGIGQEFEDIYELGDYTDIEGMSDLKSEHALRTEQNVLH